MLTITVRFDNLVTDDDYTLDYTFENESVKDALRNVDEMAMEHSFKTVGLSDGNYEIIRIKGSRLSVYNAIRTEVVNTLEWLAESGNTYDMVELHNAVAEDVHDYDRILCHMDEFNDFMVGKTPIEIINSVDDDFSTRDDWFNVNGLGFFESYADWDLRSLLMDDAEDITWSVVHNDCGHLTQFDAFALLIEYAEVIEIE